MRDIYFSKNIKYLRKSNGLTLEELADVIGVTYTSVGAYERGKSYPKVEVMLKIVDFFKGNLHDLFYTDLSSGPPQHGVEEVDERTERIIARLNIELDKKAEEIITRADPEDLEKLKALRAEYIEKYPGIAKKLGYKK